MCLGWGGADEGCFFLLHELCFPYPGLRIQLPAVRVAQVGLHFLGVLLPQPEGVLGLWTRVSIPGSLGCLKLALHVPSGSLSLPG